MIYNYKFTNPAIMVKLNDKDSTTIQTNISLESYTFHILNNGIAQER